MRMIRARDLTRTPWKNGGGETMEIAVYPVDAKLDDFEWRVSMAIVDAGGPFSTFPHIDRTLTILDGGPLGLKINDGAEIVLNSTSNPLSFAGDLPTSAKLYGTRVTDLNVMTRRGIFRHHVTPIVLDDQPRTLEGRAPFFILVRAGEINLTLEDRIETLTSFDCVFLDELGRYKIALQSPTQAAVLMVEIFAEH